MSKGVACSDQNGITRNVAETPQGNVGTCMRVFRQLLGECRLPPSVITKLGLVFVRDLTGRPYGDVPFVYPDGDDDADECVARAGA